jgi:peptide/nickel transport system permease protein
MAIGFLANEQQYVGWFPSTGLHSTAADEMTFLPTWGENGLERGYLFDMLWHLALPVTLLALSGFAYLSKLARTSILEVLNSDYVRTARAKGLSPNAVLLRHAVRTSLIPIITFVSALIPFLITGSVVIEVIFGINGMGRLFIDSIKAGDVELVLGVTLMILILKLVSYLAADVAYVIADPRVSYDQSA